MASITLEGLKKTYAGNVAAVKGVDLHIQDGEFVVLVGPSGCGKSTLLRLIAGLESITDGDLNIGGTVVNDLPPRERGVGMVFQSYAIWPHMTVYGNAAFPLQVRKTNLTRAQIKDKVMDVLNAVALDHLVERDATKLSGGQQQRLALARAQVLQEMGLNELALPLLQQAIIQAIGDGAGKRLSDVDAEARAEVGVGDAVVQAEAHHHGLGHLHGPLDCLYELHRRHLFEHACVHGGAGSCGASRVHATDVLSRRAQVVEA